MKALILFTVFLALAAGASAQQVFLMEVSGEVSPGVLAFDTPVTFHFGFSNTTGCNITGITNGLRLRALDDATWSSLSGAWDEATAGFFDLGRFVNYFGVDGTGADTVGFGASSMMSSMPIDYYGNSYSITVTFPKANSGKEIVIEKVDWYPPSGSWLWAGSPCGGIVPTWGGPYTFRIQELPCGDLNASGTVEITDLTMLIAYLFRGGPPPPCE